MAAVSVEGLSDSTVAALRFAHASAQQRVKGDPAAIDPLDLVFGILLAHPGTSPPQRLMEHFDFTLGDLKPPERLAAGPSELNGALQSIGASWAPYLDDDAQRMFDAASERRGSDGVVHLRHLWGGMLASPSGPFADPLHDLLRRRGSSITAVMDLTRTWVESDELREEDDYAAMLAAELPYSPSPIPLARYSHDRGDEAGGRDLLRLSREVDAFAYLLTSVDLRPPLAIGLFGDWGSGKTFFMDSIERRVRSITDDPAVAEVPQEDTKFWRGVVQIRFNAWHYSEGDLLASLVDHLFTELERQTAELSANPAERDRDSWVQELTEVTAQEEALRANVAEFEEQERRARTELEALDATARAALVATGGEPFLPALRDTVAAAVEPVLAEVQLGDSNVEELTETLGRARSELARSHQLGKALFGSPARLVVTLAAVALVPLLVYLIGRAQSWAGAAWVGLFAVLAEGVAALGATTRWLNKANDRIAAAQADLDRRRHDRERAITAAADAKRKELEAITAERTSAQRRVEVAAAERRRLQQRVDEPAYRLVQEFIKSRLEAGTYRERLGLHAIVREDLERLSAYIDKQNGEVLTGERPASDERMFNRIILYIDDLDRCPDEKVVKVLQAVHLLLSFDLFVVVVAVDHRWLGHALESQYPVLASYRSGAPVVADPPSANGVAGRSLRPSDYLEKIFQIPYRVRPVGVDGRRDLIDGLLRAQVRADSAGAGSEGGGHVGRLVGKPEEQVIERIVRTTSRSVNAVAQELTLTRTEYDELWAIAPLLGETPRSIKRFVNVYQLLKMMDAGGQEKSPPDFQIAALLLGLDEGRPELADKVRSLIGDDRLGSIPELKELCAVQPGWAEVDRKRLDEVDELVRRFQFP